MKTASELYEEIYDHFIWPEIATGTDYEAIKSIIADFEKEVRKEQDKITREITFTNIENHGHRFSHYFDGKFEGFAVLIKDIKQSFNNAKTV